MGLTLLLAGCSSLPGGEPYYVVEEKPVLDPDTRLPLYSVCYNALLHKREAVTDLVARNCAGATLRYNGRDLARCAAAAPVRATYSCTALSREAAEAMPNLKRSDQFTGAITF